MGQDRLVDKSNKPVHPLSVPTALNPIHVTNRASADLGTLPIGIYRGQAAFWDLDKAVNLPLVNAEKAHILGILDGREEDYDHLRIVIPDGSAVGYSAGATLTVPSGLVFFIHSVRIQNDAAYGSATINLNWRCSLWPSREDPVNEHGQSFYENPKVSAAGAAQDHFTLFYTGAINSTVPVTATQLEYKDVSLRLPAGTKIRFTASVTTAAVDTDDATCDLSLYGYVGRLLVA